jgi:hypothetical protein
MGGYRQVQTIRGIRGTPVHFKFVDAVASARCANAKRQLTAIGAGWKTGKRAQGVALADDRINQLLQSTLGLR